MLYACAAPGGQATDSPNSTAVHGYAAKVPKKNIQGHTGPHTLWDDYQSGKKSASQLLRAASRVYSPRLNNNYYYYCIVIISIVFIRFMYILNFSE